MGDFLQSNQCDTKVPLLRFLILLRALGAKQVFLTTRINFPSLWNLPRGGVWPAEWQKGKQTLPSMPRNNLGQERADKRQDSADLLPSFQPWAALSPRYAEVLHLLGMKGGRIQALSSTICLSPSQFLTVPVFPCFLERSTSQSLPGRKSQQRVDAHSWSSRLCSPWGTVLWAATSQLRPACPV